MAGVTRLKAIAVNLATLPKLARVGGVLSRLKDGISQEGATSVDWFKAKGGGKDDCGKKAPVKEMDCGQIGKIRPGGKMDESWDQPFVVIIGAGMAGLSAAQRFTQAGFHNFTVLEATNRPGGRVLSSWLSDAVVEHGAEEIWGSQMSNPIFSLASEEGVLKLPEEIPKKHGRETNILFLTSDGRAIESSGVEKLVFEKVIQQAKDLHKQSVIGGKHHQGNLQHFIGIRLQQQLLEFPSHMRYDAERMLFGQTNFLRARLGADLAKVSAVEFGSNEELPGENANIPLGFIGVLAPLLRGIPQEKILYKKPVLTINWNLNPEEEETCTRVVVKTCDGACYPADYVIITVPLGVLKSRLDTMFCPPLPEKQREAITSLGLGHQCKIFVEYSQRWWFPQDERFQLAWSHEELSDRGGDWVRGIGEVKTVPGSGHILTFTVGGPEAVALESFTEEETAIEFTRFIRKFTSDPTLPYPDSILKTNWSSDPFFMGSTSYMGLCSKAGHVKDLFEFADPCEVPDGPMLMFAGEATAFGAQGTVHGARATGIKQADKILEITRKHSGRPSFDPSPPPRPC